MSLLRHYAKFVIPLLCLLRTCFGQATTCFPLYGGDAIYPNGLFLQLTSLKPQQQNTVSTYILEAGPYSYSTVLWETTKAPLGIPASTPTTATTTTANSPASLTAAITSELAACVPPLPPGTVATLPAQAVPYQNTPLALGAQVLAVADFNRDGLLDIVTLVPGSNQVAVYLGNNAGVYQNPSMTTFGNANTKLAAIVAADFNNDGKIDLAALDTANNAVYVGFNRGDGVLLNPVTLQVGHTPLSFAVADVNLDGNADVITANSADGTVSVMRGNGNGTFLPASSFPVGKNPVSVIVQDMNHDGNPDLLVADNGSSDIAELLGYGNGGFQTAQFFKSPLPPTYIAGADFNDDGTPDVVALSEDMNGVSILLGGPQGKLTVGGSFLVPNLTASLAIADYNGDGALDLLVPDTDRGSPVLLLGHGDGTLQAPPLYPSAGGFTSLATGDFNHDGKADLITTGSSSTGSSLAILFGNGNGRFQTPMNVPAPGPTSMVGVGDFNRDGFPDLAVLGSQLTILLNTGSGTFRQGAQYSATTPSIVADLNRDGILDIAGISGGNLAVLLGNGDGTFRSANPTPVGSNPQAAVAGDFNKDGIPDVAVLNAGTTGNPSDPGGISVLLGNGTGTFPKTVSLPAGPNPRALAAGDFNGDGRTDLVVATASGTPNSFQISVYLSNGDGTFQAPFNIPLPAGETPNTVAVLDLDGDGKLDVVIGDCCSDATVSYMRGNGDGTLQPYVPFYGGNGARAIVVGDWNGDNKPDLAIAYSPAGNPSLSGIVPLLNRLANVQSLVNTNDASFFTGAIVPDSIVAAFGANLTTSTVSATGDPSSLPTSLGNTTVTVTDSKGVARQAQIYYVSPTQINYLVPGGTALGLATVSVTAPNGVTAAQVNTVNTYPGLFTVNSSGLAAATGTHVTGPNQSAFNVFYTDPTTGNVFPLPINVGAKTDSVFLSLYGTGFRARTSLDRVAVLLTTTQNPAGVFAPALYAGTQGGYLGLDQLNIQIPQSMAGSGVVTIHVTIDGVTANPVNVTVQ